MWSGDAQLLEEGWTIPDSNICSNSWRAMCRRSGARQRARADTGGPGSIDVVSDGVLGWIGGGLYLREGRKLGEESSKLVFQDVWKNGGAGCGSCG